MSYLSEKDLWCWTKMQEKWLEEILEKSIWNNLYDYNFKTNNEYTIYDYEQSPLCIIIWGEIISDWLNNKNEENEDKFVYSIKRNYLIVNNKTESYRFLFDVMNNLKSRWTEDEKCYDYHYIGNFAPIPANVKLKRSLQFIHRDFGENWNKLLEYLKINWDEYKMEGITFEDYIKMTYQDSYYSYGKFINIESIECILSEIKNRGKKIQTKIEDILKKKIIKGN